MSSIIQNLLNDVLKDGARPTKYSCQVFIPDSLSAEDEKLDTICKATAFPVKSNEVITLKYKGRDIPIPGQEKFSHSLDLTFYLEESHKSKIIFEQWQQALNKENYSGVLSKEIQNLKKEQDGNIDITKSSIILTQLNFDGDKERIQYNFYNVFPKEISAVSVAADSVGAISEYTVTFSYLYYEAYIIDESTGVADAILSGVQDIVSDSVNKLKDAAIGFLPMDDINAGASKANTKIQDIGKSVGPTLDTWLG